MKEELNMDKTFRDKLNGLSQAPPPHVWDNIQGTLVAQKRKRRMVLFSRIAAAAIVIFAFLAGWYINEKSDQVIPASAKNEKIVIETEPETQALRIENDQINTNAESQITEPEEELNETYKTKTVETIPAEFVGVKISNEIQNEKIGKNQIERFSLKMLDNMEVLFVNHQNDKLRHIEKGTQTIEISQAEKELIAENIKATQGSSSDAPKLKMGLNFAPGYSSQSSNYSEAYSNNMTYSGENGNGNMSGGFSIQIKTSKKWSVESGIYYAQNGQKSTNSLNLFSANSDYSSLSFDTEKSYFNTAVNQVNGYFAMNSNAGVIQFSGIPKGTERAAVIDESVANSDIILTSGEFAQVFDFIEIPLFLRYSIIDSKIGVEIMGGINAGIITGNNVFMENNYGNQNVGKTKDISPVNLSGTIGVGLNYALGKHISLAVEPRFNYYMNSINKNPDVIYRPYRIGVYTGLYYEF